MHRLDDSYRIGWLRAFFDGEGSVSCTSSNRSIVFANTQPVLIDEVCRYLTGFGIEWRTHTSTRPPRAAITHVIVARKESLTQFIRLVGSSVPYKRKRMADLLRWFRRPGRARRTRWGGPPIPDSGAIGALIAAGKSHAEIATHFGVRFHTMRTYIRAAGFARDHRKGAPPPIADVLSAYFDEGLSLREVGARFGYKGTSIARLLQRHGIAAKQGGWQNSRHVRATVS